MDWVGIWTFFFFLSLSVFTALAVIVTIGGFFQSPRPVSARLRLTISGC